MKIYLASKSPRRKELLKQMRIDFEVLALDVPEELKPNETAAAYSERVVFEKLTAAWEKIVHDNLLPKPVLCADTEVVLDEEILGKPRDYEHAFQMLKRCSNRAHQVITSVGIRYDHYQQIKSHITTVYFSSMSDEAIHLYLETGNYIDKAGGYGIQSDIAQYIPRIDGCFYSVMGLPLNTVRELLSTKEFLDIYYRMQSEHQGSYS